MKAIRLLDHPILTPEDVTSRIRPCARPTPNLNGPSALTVPEAVPDRLGEYYLYYSHHRGSGIGLAWADRPEGPWNDHGVVLSLQQTPFRTHLASPLVQWDSQKRRMVMLCHGEAFAPLADCSQLSIRALSEDGLTWQAEDKPYCPAYVHTFDWQGQVYGIGWGGSLMKMPSGGNPLELRKLHFHESLCPASAQDPGRSNVRHVALWRHDRFLEVFYSCIGDTPERILQGTVELEGDWTRWQARNIREVLRPEFDWEGLGLARQVEPGREPGALGRFEPACALRDPSLFVDRMGRRLMVYALQGEQGLGIAQLVEG
jgi:hypothetical protein